VNVAVTAPGKLALLGEYAVLEGAPALVMAVDRRVRVSLEPGDGPDSIVIAPGWTSAAAGFRVEPSGVAWSEGGGGELALAGHVIRGFFRRRVVSAPLAPVKLELDSSALVTRSPGGIEKLGLGSSAALTVALCYALGYYVASQHRPATPLALSELIDIHSGLQNRRGSGLDVAASVYGGLVEYRRLPNPGVRPAALPENMRYCFVWSGRQAATADFLAQIDQWRLAAPRQYAALMQSLTETSQTAIQAAGAGEGAEFLRGVAGYTAGLQALGRASGADILSAPHRRIGDIAKRAGVVYKPCGAGGGDVGIALSEDQEALEYFHTALEAEQFNLLPLRIDHSGVTSQSGN
jgi:phosphomevalonate kinase